MDIMILEEVISSCWNDIKSVDNNMSGADRSGSLNFSSYSDTIAYLIWKNHAELWISDINLRNPETGLGRRGWLAIKH